MDIRERMRELIDILNNAGDAYEAGAPIMSDEQWDSYYFALLSLEKESGITEPDSPTQGIIYRNRTQLPKVSHSHPMLSLDKTKDIEVIRSFIGSKPVTAMCKMDGLTCSLTYRNGILFRAETRGDGVVGEDITHNAHIIPSIPQAISYKGDFVVDGEIICTYSDFAPFSEEYKNPRNFAAGSIRLLNSEECATRPLTFVAWDLIKGPVSNSLREDLEYLLNLGFLITPLYPVSADNLDDVVQKLKSIAEIFQFPIDGIVFKYNDREYYNSLGSTNHHFRGGLAFKFYDELYPTTLTNIEWSMGRTGVLTPVAIFEPVEIDGAQVERASLHNLSILTDLLGYTPYIGQPLQIYRANQIIPQVYSSTKGEAPEDKILTPPRHCPICGSYTTKTYSNNTTNLICTNPDCPGKLINQLDHFCGKKGLDIKGLSKATLERLVDLNWVSSCVDIFSLADHAADWKQLPGFGEKSVNNILTAIETAKAPDLEQFLSALGIPLIGRTYAKALANTFSSYEEFRHAVKDGCDFTFIEGFGPAMHDAIISFDYTNGDELAKILNIQKVSASSNSDNSSKFAGLTFVITGKLQTFKNRDEIKKQIEARGGKVTNSVTSKTNYLINNDVNSNSTKNQTAKKLGVQIISEEEYLQL